MIKPNIVRASARGRGDITDACVVWALVKMVHEVNASARISIAEGSAGFVSPGHPEALEAADVTDGFANTGFAEIAEDPDLAGMADIDLNVVDAIVGMERARIEVVGQELAEVRGQFEKKPGWDDRSHYGQSNRTWTLKGPFPLADDHRWQPDPASLSPQPGQDGWSTPVYFWDDKINLKAHFGSQRNCVAYACAEFTAPQSQEAELWVGSDEPLVVRINGEEVYRYERTRRHDLPNDEEQIQIAAGLVFGVPGDLAAVDGVAGVRSGRRGRPDGPRASGGQRWERSLACLVGKRWHTALTNKPIPRMAVHPDGTLWLGDGGGQVTVLRVE